MEILVFLTIGIDIEVFKDGNVVFFVFWGSSAGVRPNVDSTEEFREIFEVLLAPSIERVLVALCALNSQAQESVSKTDGNGFSVSELSPHPVVGHRFVFTERFVRSLLLHAVTEIDIAFAAIATNAKNDSFNYFIVRRVGFNTFMNPVIPLLARKIVVKSNVA